MANALYFYSPLTLPELEKRVTDHQQSFEDYLNEIFSEDELASFERDLDSIAAVFVQPLFTELSFNDFFPDPEREKDQRAFFETCRSGLLLEHLPDFHSNPFQVSWLLLLLKVLDEVLIDRGVVSELSFKEPFIEELRRYRSIDSIISSPIERPVELRRGAPVSLVDFLVIDVYKEMDRLKDNRKIYFAMEQVESLPEKTGKLFAIMMKEKLDAESLLRRSALTPKDFGDHIEKLKFFLRKL